MSSSTIQTVSQAREAGLVIIGEWSDHLHHYRDGYLAACPEDADAVRRAYDADLIRDDADLSQWYERTGAMWVAAD